MYAEMPCQLCGDDDGFVRWFSGSITVALCHSCYEKADVMDRYSHHFVQTRCPTCGQTIKHLQFIKYKEDDKYQGRKVKQCERCLDWFVELEIEQGKDVCMDCQEKMRDEARLNPKPNLIVMCECGHEMEQKIRQLPSGRRISVMTCWMCGRENEPETIAKIKPLKPSHVPMLDRFIDSPEGRQ